MTTVNATYDRVVVCILMQERAELAEREAKEKEKAGQNKTSFKGVWVANYANSIVVQSKTLTFLVLCLRNMS